MTIFGIYAPSGYRHTANVLNTEQLLARLEEKGVRNIDIARALEMPESRASEIRKRKRTLKFDEGARLVEAFGLEQGPQVSPLPDSVLRLVIRHIAEVLSVEADDQQLRELTADLQAFARFVADPQVRESLEAAEGFFRAMRFRRPGNGAEAPPQRLPQNAR